MPANEFSVSGVEYDVAGALLGGNREERAKLTAGGWMWKLKGVPSWSLCAGLFAKSPSKSRKGGALAVDRELWEPRSSKVPLSIASDKKVKQL